MKKMHFYPIHDNYIIGDNMGIKSFFMPTKGKAALFVVITIFLVAVWTTRIAGFGVNPAANPDVLVMIFALLSFPIIFQPVYATPLSLLVLVYVYVIACIYANAYCWLDSSLRRKYPKINARWAQRKKLR